jgi:hypothetical protein
MHPPSHLRKARLSAAGSTLVEAMIACGIISLFMAGLYDMNWRGLFMLKAGVDIASATQVSTNLAEQIRTATWTQITDPTYLSGTILTNSTAVGHLPNVVQKIDVNPYPIPAGYGSPPLGGATVEVQRDASGNVSTTYAGNSTLASQSAIQIDITLTWISTFKSRSHSRMVRLIASPGGVLGQN